MAWHCSPANEQAQLPLVQDPEQQSALPLQLAAVPWQRAQVPEALQTCPLVQHSPLQGVEPSQQTGVPAVAEAATALATTSTMSLAPLCGRGELTTATTGTLQATMPR